MKSQWHGVFAKSEWRDYLSFVIGVFVMGFNVWGATINAFFYIFMGRAETIFWFMANYTAIALVTWSTLRAIRLSRVGRLLDLCREAIKEAQRHPTPENARKVIALTAQTHALVEKYFPKWNR